MSAKARLQAQAVIATLERLHERIEERFPEAGLSTVAKDLTEYSRTISTRARRIGRPYAFLRLLNLLLIVGAAGGAAWMLSQSPIWRWRIGADLATVTAGMDAAVHLVLIAGAGVWTLLSFEQRLKRSQALGDLYQLRSYAHVVDMHQLTKDPTVILSHGPTTPASPKREMNQFQLTRYLDYCSEMLSLIGKLAALYGEYTRDPQVVEAINGVEDLCGNLGRKIWQKITILSALDETRTGGVPANTP